MAPELSTLEWVNDVQLPNPALEQERQDERGQDPEQGRARQLTRLTEGLEEHAGDGSRQGLDLGACAEDESKDKLIPR